MELRDLRAAPPDLTVPQGPYSRPASVRVVHSVGSDTVIGKKVVTLELDRAARERGERSVYVPTGQTGVAIAGWGIAVDHVISDYVAGAGERLVNEGSARGDPYDNRRQRSWHRADERCQLRAALHRRVDNVVRNEGQQRQKHREKIGCGGDNA